MITITSMEQLSRCMITLTNIGQLYDHNRNQHWVAVWLHKPALSQYIYVDGCPI